MIEADAAMELIHRLIVAEVEVVNRGTQGAIQREERAARALFVALVDRKPSAEELDSITRL